MTSLESIDIVILSGGLGTRLKEEIGDEQKVMAEINGRPFLDFHINWLKNQGAERIILCTGYKAGFVEDYYRKNDFGIVIDFSREEQPLGTGGAIVNAAEIINSDPFIVLNGDSFCPVNLYALLKYHKDKKAVASVVVTSGMKGQDYGQLIINEDEKVAEFAEKTAQKEGGYVNAGVYCFSHKIFDAIGTKGKSSLENDWFPKLIDQPFYAFTLNSKFFDIGTPERYKQAQKFFAED
ncbi:MAG: nucleotidyltransferase family protein [Candidatus Omnitrophica bacterium]|nr:nucleotidyltransferase family protein [Candidatus Omnitrophota bacterium]